MAKSTNPTQRRYAEQRLDRLKIQLRRLNASGRRASPELMREIERLTRLTGVAAEVPLEEGPAEKAQLTAAVLGQHLSTKEMETLVREVEE